MSTGLSYCLIAHKKRLWWNYHSLNLPVYAPDPTSHCTLSCFCEQNGFAPWSIHHHNLRKSSSLPAEVISLIALFTCMPMPALSLNFMVLNITVTSFLKICCAVPFSCSCLTTYAVIIIQGSNLVNFFFVFPKTPKIWLDPRLWNLTIQISLL